MLRFFQMLGDLWLDLISVFDSHPLTIGDYSVSYTSILFAFLAISIVVTVFWKGSKG